jgi:hypothetical protein
VATELETVTTLLAQYLSAEAAILTGAQSYTIGNRSLTRAHLAEIIRERKNLEIRKQALDGEGGIRPRRVVFRDN